MVIKKGLLLFLTILIFSCKKKVDYYHIPTFSENNILNVVIEIPAGTNKKYEYNKEEKAFEIDQKNGKDRIIQFLPYPGNYGYIPSTFSDPKKGGDGDALDVLVLSESVPIGAIVEVTPIAVLKLIDDGEIDYKIIAIPHSQDHQIIKVKTYKELAQNFPEAIKIIEMWFLNYNPSDTASIDGWGDEKEAIIAIENDKLK